MTIDNWLDLYLLYVKAEKAKKQSIDGTTPIPFYLIGFLGAEISSGVSGCVKKRCDKIFSRRENLQAVYGLYSNATKFYKQAMKNQKNVEYNLMIKQPIDNEILYQSIEQARDFISTIEERNLLLNLLN